MFTEITSANYYQIQLLGSHNINSCSGAGSGSALWGPFLVNIHLATIKVDKGEDGIPKGYIVWTTYFLMVKFPGPWNFFFRYLQSQATVGQECSSFHKGKNNNKNKILIFSFPNVKFPLHSNISSYNLWYMPP